MAIPIQLRNRLRRYSRLADCKRRYARQSPLLDSWVSPSGRVIPNNGRSHVETLAHYHVVDPAEHGGRVDSMLDSAFSSGWHRVVAAGKSLVANNPYSPPNHHQLASLEGIAHANGMREVLHDNDRKQRVVWSEANQMQRRYSLRASTQRRYAAVVPPLPEDAGPDRVPPHKFAVRVAKRAGMDKFLLHRYAPAKAEAHPESGDPHRWVWAPMAAPQVINSARMRQLIQSGGVKKNGPPVYSPVHPSIVARIEGRRTVVPQRATAPAGKLRETPSTRFKRRYARNYADESHQFLEHIKRNPNDWGAFGAWSDWTEEHGLPTVARLMRLHQKQGEENDPQYGLPYRAGGFRLYPTFSPRGWSFYTGTGGDSGSAGPLLVGIGITHHSEGEDSTDRTIKETGDIEPERPNRRGWYVPIGDLPTLHQTIKYLRSEGIPQQGPTGREIK